jgi:hypothetical protein
MAPAHQGRLMTRQATAIRQIIVAIYLLHQGEWESAITVALGAEGYMPNLPEGNALYFWGELQKRASQEELIAFNETKNWLKHAYGSDQRYVTNYEAVMAIMLAISKYVALYGEVEPVIEKFITWSVAQGYIGPT